ncbi:hypothetical protein [Piscinibacter gummiphilus]|jgi:hypothetical protein|uniref:Uncharacterized protein n=1 Tax=Piscinibacter gummiphilus TaxID=946333 RepID=A0ABZ0D235_9BURK|nr:hypothetical protein [Piscinibacter gummiphilus]WOB11243.1 hypothetical protein RXV79_26795 [Piscinibacter gummiphilus]
MWTRRMFRIGEYIQGLRATPSEQLKAIVQEKRYPVLLREAALRWLVHLAPVEVTKGAPFAVRRRLVRQHHRV